MVFCSVSWADDSVAEWVKKFKVGADFRYRHENIDREGRKGRDRQRIRARITLKGKVNDDLDLKFRVASGSEDPVSTNQTLDDGFSSKDVNLDQAFFDWHPEELGNSHILGGKMEMPFEVVKDLIWDGDLSPEGLAFSHGIEVGDDATVTATLAGFWGEERSSADDTMMYGGQLAVDVGFSDDASVMGGVSYYYWDNTKGFSPLFDATDSFGNTVVTAMDGSLTYADDYGELEFFAVAKLDLGIPVKLYGDLVINQEADISSEDTGWMLGATLNKAKEPGSWALDYNYRELEADAVLAAYTDSDSFGGGTDGRGHKISGKYQIDENFQLAVSYFINETGISGVESDYNRLQVDLKAKI
jgi:hypothetical protein